VRSIHGTGISQAGVWAKLLDDESLAIPPHPGPLVLLPVRVPDPPLLDPALPVPARALTMALAYKGAVEARYTGLKLPRLVPPGGIAQSKHYPSFAAGAMRLTEAKVAPAAWCMFSVDVWRTPGAAGRPHRSLPPPSMVCSRKRIEERLEWFAEEAAAYSRGKLLLTDEHRDLLRAHGTAQSALILAVLQQAPQERLLALAREHFKGWDARIESARASNALAQADLQAALSRGLWLWR
jgi:hypothetical protein